MLGQLRSRFTPAVFRCCSPLPASGLFFGRPFLLGLRVRRRLFPGPNPLDDLTPPSRGLTSRQGLGRRNAVLAAVRSPIQVVEAQVSP